MPRVRLQRGLLKWGNAYGIRITRAEAERLDVKEKSPLIIDIQTDPPRIDLARITVMHLGGPDLSANHTQLAEDAADADLRH